MTWHIKYFPDTRDHSKANYRGVDKWVEENQGKHFCQCGCGKAITITAWMHTKMGISKFLSGHNFKTKEGKEKQSEMASQRTGQNAAHWKHGLTTQQEVIRKSKKYIAWRDAIFRRDDYTCQKCNARSGNGKAVFLHAHHTPKTFKILWKEWKSGERTKESLFDISLGVTLCVPCHRKIHRRTSSGRKKSRGSI